MTINISQKSCLSSVFDCSVIKEANLTEPWKTSFYPVFLGVQYLNGTAEIIKLHRAIIRAILVNSQKDGITNVNLTDIDKVINIIKSIPDIKES